MKTRNDCEIACDCVKRANVVLHVGLCQGSKNRFSNTRQGGSKRKVLVPKVAV